jgi:hypothetical protein
LKLTKPSIMELRSLTPVLGRPEESSMRLRLATLLLLAAPGAFAGVAAPHLIPIDREYSLLSSSPAHRAYHLAVRDALLGPSTHSACEALVLPSFEREWAVHIRRARPVGKEVVCSVMQEQLWGRMETAAEQPNGSITPADELAALRRIPKAVWRFSAPVSDPTAEALERVWELMLNRAHEPSEQRLTLDGVSYYFFQWRYGRYHGGIATSPQEDTEAAALTRLVEAMRLHAGSSGTALVRSDIRLVQDATSLYRRLVVQRP